jgi:hypothetical protein
MTTIASTRFNAKTWEENCSYREREKFPGCIYCAPTPLSQKIPSSSIVFVVEMNNTLNKIEGIGVIKNIPNYNFTKRDRFYEDSNYNAYVYKGGYRLSRNDLKQSNSRIVKALDNILFKGKSHLKRGSGIKTIPEKLLKHDSFAGMNLEKELKEIFTTHFQKEIAEKKELKKEHHAQQSVPISI